ncbi:tyrosine-type recombinase/integrase [Rhizobium rhizogenes]
MSTAVEETLDQALSRVWETEWMHRRSGPTLKSQAETALKAVSYWADEAYHVSGVSPPPVTASRITQTHIQQATKAWYIGGLSPATITKRLNCLSKLGVNVEGCRVKVPNQLKWHLKESDKPKVLAWLRAKEYSQWVILADFIEWTTLTGLRVEESLRLDFGDFEAAGFSEVSVPGLKTSASQATLPLGAAAQRVAMKRAEEGTTRFFPTDYEELQTCWQAVREHFGWQDDPTATLKALRRSAARYLHVDCGMPIHMVQQYLRHESLETTLGYLKLTGGYGTEEMRRYLK